MTQQNVEDIYTLSPAQQGMLLYLQLTGFRSQVYFEQYTATLAGSLDAAAWRAAWQLAVERHAALRTLFVWERREQPLQVVRRKVELPWQELDWSGLDAVAVEERWRALLRDDHERGIDPRQAPLMRVATVRLAPDVHRLVWTFSHLVLDGWSIAVVLGEALAAYAAARQGAAPNLAPAPPFRGYIDWLQRQDPARAEAFWRHALAGWTAPTPLPFDGTGDAGGTDHTGEPGNIGKAGDIGRPGNAGEPAGSQGTGADGAAKPGDGSGSPTGWLVAEERQLLAPAAAQALRQLARRHQVTLATVFQAAWGLLLGRYGGGEDVVFGAVVSGRPPELAGVESIAGVFINALPVRLRLEPAQPLGPWLRDIQTQQSEQRDFEHCPYEQIHAWSGLEHQVPLFESLLVFENYPAPDATADLGLAVCDVRLREANNHPLSCYVSPGGGAGGIEIKLQYHWARLGAPEVRRLLASLATLLAELAAHPEARLGEMEALSAAEAAELIAAGRGPRRHLPAGDGAANVYAPAAAAAARTPHAVAVEQGAEHLSYGELVRRAELLARQLSRRGAGPGSVVAVALPRSPRLLIAMLGTLAAGAAYLPLDPAYPRERLAFLIADAGVRLLLTARDVAAGAGLADIAGGSDAVICDTAGITGELPGVCQVVYLDALEPQGAGAGFETGAAAAPAAALPLDAAYVIYTSGSTGRPKAVVVPHAALAGYVSDAAAAHGLLAADRVLQMASIGFDTSAEEIYPCLAAGATLVLRDDVMVASLDGFWRAVERLQVTVLDLPTAYWHELAAVPAALPAALRLTVIGGEEAQADRLAAWRDRTGARVRLLNTYGPTEATIVTTRCDLTLPAYGVPADAAAPVPIGRPISGARVHLLDRRLRLLPHGVEGELYIGGAGLARGYLGRPELTAERFVPDPFGAPGDRLYRSGDLARWTAGGDLVFRGRADHQVKIRGFRVELGEIETALGRLPGVRAAVAGLHGGGTARRLVAWVVAEPAENLTAGGLRKALAGTLPDYMIPAAFVFPATLPRNASGKIDRRALPAPDATRPDLGTGYAAPQNPVQEVLAAQWSELLGVEAIGIDDDFFQLGGHSLLVARLAARVRQAFGVELPVVAIFQQPTVAALAAAIEQAGTPAATASGAAAGGAAGAFAGELPRLPPIERVPRDQPIPLSFPQERVWFLDQLSPGGNIAYNFQVTIWLRGRLDPGVLRRTLGEITRRHEVLRTSFPARSGLPVQVIHPPRPVDLPLLDLTGLPEERRQPLAEALFAAAVQVPFDIARAPLIRWRLLKLADDLWELIQVEHHFVHDGWSFAVLLGEIKAIYPALLAGEPSPLPEPPVQYADFAAWQRRWMAGPAMERLLAFWRQKLAGAPPGLEIATDRPRPARASFAGDVELFLLPEELYDGLRRQSRREGFTLYMTMLAGFFTLLHRYTGAADMVIGTSNANRRAHELEGMIGMVVNSLLLRGDLAGAPTFRQLLGRVRALTLEVYAHQDMPFERLVQELRPERQLGRNPLFQIMYNFHDASVPDLEFGGLDVKFLVRGNRSAKMDINVIVIPRAEQRVGLPQTAADRRAILHWEYNTDLFDRATILRLVDHYLTLLQGAVDDPGRPLSELPLLSDAERQQLIEERPGADGAHPAADRTRISAAAALAAPRQAMHRRFAAHARRTPDSVAVVAGDLHLTYGELDGRSTRLARRLRRLGVGPEVAVPLCVRRGGALVSGILGILKAGGGYVPVDPDYPAERIAWILEDSQAGTATPLVVAGADALAALPPGPARRVVLDGDDRRGTAAADEAAAAIPAAPEPLEALGAAPHDAAPGSPSDDAGGSGAENLAYVIYTSGSTGRPKGVPIRHANIDRLFGSTESWFGSAAAGADGVWTLFHSFAFDFSVWELWGALAHGGRLVIVPQAVSRAPEELYLLLARQQVTVLNQTPSAFRQLIAAEEALAHRGQAPPLPALRTVIFGGEALDLPSLRPWFERHGDARPRLVNMYGITETTVHATFRPLHRADAEPGAGLGSRIGIPLPDMTIHLLDAAANLVPAGVPGEIHVGGGGVGAGYLNRPELTAERFLPDPFATRPGARMYRSGDLARRRPGGDLEYLGRIDNQVKVRGFRIELGEIEAALSAHPQVGEAAVATVANAAGETGLAAYVVPRAAPAPDAQALRQFLKASLPDHMVPASFTFLAALPLTAHGKVDRRALPAPDAAPAGGEHIAPRTPSEQAVAAIWRDVLGMERIGVSDDFFLLGGHSLSAARILARIRDTLGVNLPLATLFDGPTVAELAAAADAGLAAHLSAAGIGADDEALLVHAAGLPDSDLDALLQSMLAQQEGK